MTVQDKKKIEFIDTIMSWQNQLNWVKEPNFKNTEQNIKEIYRNPSHWWFSIWIKNSLQGIQFKFLFFCSLCSFGFYSSVYQQTFIWKSDSWIFSRITRWKHIHSDKEYGNLSSVYPWLRKIVREKYRKRKASAFNKILCSSVVWYSKYGGIPK